jgi:hypothetical protein
MKLNLHLIVYITYDKPIIINIIKFKNNVSQVLRSNL